LSLRRRRWGEQPSGDGGWQRALIRPSLCILAFALYAQWRSPPILETEGFRDGWYTLDLRLQRTYTRTSARAQQIYGQGILLDGPALAPSFRGQRVYFMLDEKFPQRHYRGQTLRVRAHLQLLRGSTAAHSFESYLQRVRIPLHIDRGDIRSVVHEGPAFFRHCRRLQEHARAQLLCPQGDTHLLRGMLLNCRGDLPRSQKQLFARTGVAHLLAISGLHVDIIGWALGIFLKFLRLSRRRRRLPCILLLGLYTWVIGAPPSAVRAFLMRTYLGSAGFFSRRASTLSAISFAGLLSLLAHPQQLWDWGMQFSYGAVLCIALLGSPLANHLARRLRSQAPNSLSWRHWLRPLLSYGLNSFCISAPIALLTLPLSIEYFGSFSLGGILINLIAIPLALGLIIGGFCSLVIGCLFDGLSRWILTQLLLPYLRGFEGILRFCDEHLACFWTCSTALPGLGLTTLLGIMALSLIGHHQYRKHFCRTRAYQIAMEQKALASCPHGGRGGSQHPHRRPARLPCPEDPSAPGIAHPQASPAGP
ncbi:MAG: ComEC/Rec2 family competence protein, partial [Puniceicoccales bacterium]|nr:ComEC/Rec2 family competence protein [Puniceicoccales bacterium]